ncbi:MAG: hypothetical protein ACLRT5_06900 [Lachnospiraceae bacterium]
MLEADVALAFGWRAGFGAEAAEKFSALHFFGRCGFLIILVIEIVFQFFEETAFRFFFVHGFQLIVIEELVVIVKIII